MKKSIILIDGSNFYFKLKSLGFSNQLNFNYSTFSSFLARETKLISVTYYVGKVRTDGSKKAQVLHQNQQKLFAILRKHNCSYTLGYLLKSGGKYHEKGVDVQLAVDILVSAYENIADHIILLSSDTDLIPAVRKAQSMGKTVEYIGFSHQKSIALIAECKSTRLLNFEEIKEFS